MAMKARYTVVEGEVVSEVRLGIRKDYVPDPLGSTVALLDNSQSVTDSWEYWPYGEVRTGSSATPFQFVGTLGYYKDSSRRTYVRARHYRQSVGKWLTVDLLWPVERPYSYSGSSPSTSTDPTGTCALPFATINCTKAMRYQICDSFKTALCPRVSLLEKCLGKVVCAEPYKLGAYDQIAALCSNSSSTVVTLHCQNWGDPRCNGGCAYIKDRTTVVICDDAWTSKCPSLHCIILHELIHLFGYRHGKPEPYPTPYDCVGDIPSCRDNRHRGTSDEAASRLDLEHNGTN
ncbi:MAG: hypothetical protein JST30_11445 [Armatimonadetes bacterium]|nr:hypothetical protein [Armatimonadota bacterium]